MNVEFLTEEKHLTQDVTPILGSFMALNANGSNSEWKKCREQFASNFTATIPGFFFSHKPNNGHNVAAFIAKTEEILALTNKLDVYTKFGRTNRLYATWIELTKFWSECECRRSLFTILLRCGDNYDAEADNYEEALDSVGYSKNTIIAVRRFLYGHTRFNKANPGTSGMGWYSLFHGKPIEDVCNLLVSPVETAYPKTTLGLGTIWN